MGSRADKVQYILILALLLSLSNLIYGNSIRKLFLKSLPDIEYYSREKEVFEGYGRKLHSLVLVVPPFKFDRSEIRELLEYAEMVNRTLPFTIIWSLNGSHDLQYVEMLSSELSSHKVNSRVFADLPPYLLAPLKGLAELWVREKGAWRRLDGPTEGYGDGMWRCNEIYHGLIYPKGDVWWFYYDQGRPSGCTREEPPLTACDVHMIFRANFLGLGEGVALITFTGSEPAANCGGSCGSTNTLFNGACELGRRRLRGVMFVSYMMTHTKKDPCPYYSYCGCFGSCDDLQIFISDVRGVGRDD